jgi:hypothetical protein
MKEANGARAATDEHPGTPEVAPRFTRAVKAVRSRLEDKRAQLLRKREAAQAEVASSIEPWKRLISCSTCSRLSSPPTVANPTRLVRTEHRMATRALARSVERAHQRRSEQR